MPNQKFPVSHLLPKAEMHVHISLSLSTPRFFERVDQKRTDLGYGFVKERNARYYPDLKNFHAAYESMRGLTSSAEELAQVTQDYLEMIAHEGAIYSEISNSYRDGAAFDIQMEALAEGIRRARDNTGIETRIVVTSLRNNGYAFAEKAASDLAHKKPEFVTAFGLVGDEMCDPFYRYERALNIAFHEAGLGLTPHVAEQDIENALDFLKVLPTGALNVSAVDHRRVRVGHGTLIHTSSELMQEFSEKQICAEMCLSAHNRIGMPSKTLALRKGDRVFTDVNKDGVLLDNDLRHYFNDLSMHPISTFSDYRIPMVLGSDNPLLLNTNIAKEYSLATSKAGYKGDPITFTKDAIQYANVDAKTRNELSDRVFEYEMLAANYI